jgi:hypothetical protein
MDQTYSLTDLIQDLQDVVHRLDSLQNRSQQIIDQYIGDDFDEQINLVENILDNKILEVTHEIASHMQFAMEELRIIGDFINFRKEFKQYQSHELKQIIDNDKLTISEKKILLKNNLDNFKDIKKIKIRWNDIFENKNYESIVQKITTH